MPIFPRIEQLHILSPGIVRAGQLSAKKPCAEEQPRQGTCRFAITGCHRNARCLLRTVTTWWHRWRACYTFKLDWHLHSQITECWILNWNWIELSCHLKSEENYTMNNGTTRSSAFNCELGDSGSEKCPGEENLARWNVELRNNLKHTSDLIVLNSAFLEL